MTSIKNLIKVQFQSPAKTIDELSEKQEDFKQDVQYDIKEIDKKIVKEEAKLAAIPTHDRQGAASQCQVIIQLKARRETMLKSLVTAEALQSDFAMQKQAILTNKSKALLLQTLNAHKENAKVWRRNEKEYNKSVDAAQDLCDRALERAMPEHLGQAANELYQNWLEASVQTAGYVPTGNERERE